MEWNLGFAGMFGDNIILVIRYTLLTDQDGFTPKQTELI